MFPSHGSTAQWPGKIISNLTTNAPDRAPRDDRLAPGVQGVQPTAHRPVRTNGTLTTSPSDKAPRDNRPSPGDKGAVPTKCQSTNIPPGPTRSPAKPAPIPHKAPRETRPATEVPRVLSTKPQPTKPPGPTRIPATSADILSRAPRENRIPPRVQRIARTEQRSANTPEPSYQQVRFSSVLTPNNPPGRRQGIALRLCQICRQTLHDVRGLPYARSY